MARGGLLKGVIRLRSSGYEQAKTVARHVWQHPSNRNHRVSRLAYAAGYQLWTRSTGRPLRVKVGDHSQMNALLHFAASSEVVYANPPAIELLTWSRHLKEGDWFIDIGAAVGVYTIFATEAGARVTAFEPNTAMARLFCQNMELNRYTPEFHELAVSNRSGQMNMTFDLDVANHLVFEPDARSQDVRQVEVVMLDDVIGDATVQGVKIDTEGTERLVLEGGQRALRDKRIRMLQLEWNYASIKVLGQDRTPVAEMLLDFGYELLRPAHDGSLSRPVKSFAVTHEDLFAVAPD
jgi:FkbM family methyltransferase